MIPEITNIVSAVSTGDYKLCLTFDDGMQQTVDFYPFLAQSQHPHIRAYLDVKRFSGFRIHHGELVWGDYELCFPVADLYRNTIDHHAAFEKAA